MRAETEEAASLEADIENLQQQLKEHRRTFERGDESDGVGYVAAKDRESKGGVNAEVHNHLNGILQSNELIAMAYGEGREYEALKDIYENTVIKEQQRKAELESQGITPGDNEGIKQVEKFYKDNGLIDDEGFRKLEDVLQEEKADDSQKPAAHIAKLNQEKIRDLADDLFRQNERISFETVYPLTRGYVTNKITGSNAELYLDRVLGSLAADKVNYVELQGNLPEGVAPETWQKLQDKHGVRVEFLDNVSSKTLEGNKKGLKKVKGTSKKPGLELGKNGVIGIDFAGPEATFTPKGMENFKEIYEHIASKADSEGTTVVIRPHVGEGNPKTNHPEKRINAANNLHLMIDAIKQLKAEGKLSNNVILRFGHATHASAKQLQDIKDLEIIVEANLTSNLRTKAVEGKTQMQQTILKFIYQDVNVILNTDGGGMMNTTLPQEYKEATKAIRKFKEGKIGIPIEEYDPVSKEITTTEIIYYKDLTKEQRKKFNRSRLERNSRDYRNKMVNNNKNK